MHLWLSGKTKQIFNQSSGPNNVTTMPLVRPFAATLQGVVDNNPENPIG